ncbi:MAG: hypothetical protein M1286_03825 [Candidatus Marsarchaeota archaeon]|nr:hypothetical protein [Candidatus Marsarchaeota archaeon]
MRAQASIEFLLIGSAVAAMCLFVISMYSRGLFSQTSALAAITGSFPNVSSYQPPSFLFNVSAPTTTTIAQAAYAAAITQRNESTAYALSPPAYIANLTEFSHCTGFGFFGHPFNVSDQCGTPDTWEYFAGYDCTAMSGAYCIVPHNTTYALLQPAGHPAYIYSFTLSLSTAGGEAYASVNSVVPVSMLMLNGHGIGNVTVESVTSAAPPPEQAFMYHNSSYLPVNQTYYSLYLQDRNALYPMLSFYNGTSVDSATQSEIEQAVAAYANAQLHLVNSTAQQSGCGVVTGNYLCTASSPFLYLINVTLSQGTGYVNQTVYYLGSVINVRSQA